MCMSTGEFTVGTIARQYVPPTHHPSAQYRRSVVTRPVNLKLGRWILVDGYRAGSTEKLGREIETPTPPLPHGNAASSLLPRHPPYSPTPHVSDLVICHR